MSSSSSSSGRRLNSSWAVASLGDICPTRSMHSGPKLEMITWSLSPRSVNSSTTSWVTRCEESQCGSRVKFLISMLTSIPPSRSSTSAKSITSLGRSAVAVLDTSRPSGRTGSWITARPSSRVRRTSSSTPSHPSERTRSNDARLFNPTLCEPDPCPNTRQALISSLELGALCRDEPESPEQSGREALQVG